MLMIIRNRNLPVNGNTLLIPNNTVMLHETLSLVGRQNYALKFTPVSCKSLQIRTWVSSSSQSSQVNNHCLFSSKSSTSGHDITSCNRMIINFTNSRELISARQLFDEMPERDVVSWNSMMTVYSRSECYKEALQLFSEMQRSHFKPNHTSFSTVLNSCGKVRALDQGRQIHGLSIKTQSSANLFVGEQCPGDI